MVTKLQFKKLTDGAPIVLQVRRTRNEPVQRFHATLMGVQEQREPSVGEMASEMHDFNYGMLLRDVIGEMGSNDTTSASELTRYMRSKLGGSYRGTFPASKKPVLNDKKPYTIVNTKDRGMGHWLGMIWTPQGIIVYDSLAIDGMTEDDAEQSIVETNCGQRAAAWLLFAKEYGVREAMKI
jgi:hypothetical protein